MSILKYIEESLMQVDEDQNQAKALANSDKSPFTMDDLKEIKKHISASMYSKSLGWIAKHWEELTTIYPNIESIGNIVSKYLEYSGKNIGKNTTLSNFKTALDFKKYINTLQMTNFGTKSAHENNYKTLWENKDKTIRVVVPRTKLASIKLGTRSHWCTAASDNNSGKIYDPQHYFCKYVLDENGAMVYVINDNLDTDDKWSKSALRFVYHGDLPDDDDDDDDIYYEDYPELTELRDLHNDQDDNYIGDYGLGWDHEYDEYLDEWDIPLDTILEIDTPISIISDMEGERKNYKKYKNSNDILVQDIDVIKNAINNHEIDLTDIRTIRSIGNISIQNPEKFIAIMDTIDDTYSKDISNPMYMFAINNILNSYHTDKHDIFLYTVRNSDFKLAKENPITNKKFELTLPVMILMNYAMSMDLYTTTMKHANPDYSELTDNTLNNLLKQYAKAIDTRMESSKLSTDDVKDIANDIISHGYTPIPYNDENQKQIDNIMADTTTPFEYTEIMFPGISIENTYKYTISGLKETIDKFGRFLNGNHNIERNTEKINNTANELITMYEGLNTNDKRQYARMLTVIFEYGYFIDHNIVRDAANAIIGDEPSKDRMNILLGMASTVITQKENIGAELIFDVIDERGITGNDFIFDYVSGYASYRNNSAGFADKVDKLLEKDGHTPQDKV